MKLIDIRNETDLREWLRDQSMPGVTRQWVEPSPLLGSDIGCADVILKYGEARVDLELKYLYRTRNGIKYLVRPSQRRFHHMTMRRGGRTAMLFILDETQELYLMRGDHIPLRNYASHPESGCVDGKEIVTKFAKEPDGVIALLIKYLLFLSADFWARH
jgi:hypothetical protein